MVHVKVNDQTIEVPEGTTVLQATRLAGVQIPTLCDHPNLTPYGGCRLCVVEVEGMRTLQASCTLPVFDGISVQTDTDRVHKARQFVLQLLFSERNHFCMYCQKGSGDCELQNAAYGEGMTHWPLQPTWKPFQVDASGPNFVVDHNRCILCRRCVRACAELVGNSTLSIENRGANSLVVADVGLPLGESTCINCGTCVQVCPTGALIDRFSAYLGNDAQLEHVRSICLECGFGCGVELLVRDNRLVRIDGDWEAPVNQGVLCEKGRYQSLSENRARIKTPLVRKNGALVPASWEEAYDILADRLSSVGAQNGGGIAAAVSARLSTEALFTMKNLFQDRLSAELISTSESFSSNAGGADRGAKSSYAALKEADCVVVAGTDLLQSNPVASFFVKRRFSQGTRLVVIDSQPNALRADAHFSLIPTAGTDSDLLHGILAAVTGLGGENSGERTASSELRRSLSELAQRTQISEEQILGVSRLIAAADRPVFVVSDEPGRPDLPRTVNAVEALSQVVGGEVVRLFSKANGLEASRFAHAPEFPPAGCAFVYLALGDDEPSPGLARDLETASFVAVQASFASPVTEMADVVLPAATWLEQEGHYFNSEGCLQLARKAVEAPAQIRTNVDILEALANRLGVELGERWEEPLSSPLPGN